MAQHKCFIASFYILYRVAISRRPIERNGTEIMDVFYWLAIFWFLEKGRKCQTVDADDL